MKFYDLTGTMYVRLAERYVAKGQLKKAVEALHVPLKVNPLNRRVLVGLVWLYTQLGEYLLAEDFYKKAHAVDPDNLRLRMNNFELRMKIGEMNMQQKRFAEAASSFRQAIEMYPESARAHLNLGTVLDAEGGADEAENHYRRALEINPKLRHAHFALGRLLVIKGDYESAFTHLQQTLEPEDAATPGYLRGLALAYARANEFALAETTFDRANNLAARMGNQKILKLIETDRARLAAVKAAE